MTTKTLSPAPNAEFADYLATALVNAIARLRRVQLIVRQAWAERQARKRRQRIALGAAITLGSLSGHVLTDIGVRPGSVQQYATIVAEQPGEHPAEVLGAE